jgi:hypothetical protein
MRQDFVHQQGGTVGHSSRPAAAAKTAALATERHQPLVMAGLTSNPQKTMFKPSAFQVGLKFLYDVGR